MGICRRIIARHSLNHDDASRWRLYPHCASAIEYHGFGFPRRPRYLFVGFMRWVDWLRHNERCYYDLRMPKYFSPSLFRCIHKWQHNERSTVWSHNSDDDSVPIGLQPNFRNICMGTEVEPPAMVMIPATFSPSGDGCQPRLAASLIIRRECSDLKNDHDVIL